MSAKPFAIWLTGLPASGKTTLANLLSDELHQRNLPVEVLDSDRLRKILIPAPTYSEEEHDWFYQVMAYIGKLLVKNGINVIFAATAHRRIHRERAREYLPNLIEVYVHCSVKTCALRDTKGIYEKALSGEATTVPGIQVLYEEPEMPVMTIDTEENSPLEGVQIIIGKLVEFRRIPGGVELLSQT